jgi:hypothetical protein
MIDRYMIYKLAYETIKDSLDWGSDANNKEFFNFVDGVMAVTGEILYEMNKTSKEDINND